MLSMMSTNRHLCPHQHTIVCKPDEALPCTLMP